MQTIRDKNEAWLREFPSLTKDYREFILFEQEASSIYHYSMAAVPGLLQTNAYARAIVLDNVHKLSNSRVDEHVMVRMKRQWQLFERPDPPKIFSVIEESVLYREYGGAEVLHEQLKHLLHLLNLPFMELRILPFTAAYKSFMAICPVSTVLEFSNRHPDIVYLEDARDGMCTAHTQEVLHYRYGLHSLHEVCVDEEVTRVTIQKAIDKLVHG